MAKRSKARSRRRVGMKDLTLGDVKRTKGGADPKGGRKAGEKPVEYLVVKMNDVIVTSVQP